MKQTENANQDRCLITPQSKLKGFLLLDDKRHFSQHVRVTIVGEPQNGCVNVFDHARGNTYLAAVKDVKRCELHAGEEVAREVKDDIAIHKEVLFEDLAMGEWFAFTPMPDSHAKKCRKESRTNYAKFLSDINKGISKEFKISSTFAKVYRIPTPGHIKE